MTNLLLTIFILLLSKAYAQDKVISFENFSNEKIKEVYGQTNATEDSTLVLIKHAKGISAKLDVKEGNQKSISLATKNVKTEAILGSLKGANKYAYFMFDVKKRTLNKVIFDFKNLTTSSSPVNVDLKGFKILQSYKEDNAINLVLVNKSSDKIQIVKLDMGNSRLTHTFNNKNIFLSNLGRKISLYNFAESDRIVKATPEFPLSLKQSTSYAKMYIQPEKISIILDANDKLTGILNLFFDNEDAILQVFGKPVLEETPVAIRKKTSSTLVNNNLYQISSNKNEVKIIITNTKDNTIVKELGFKKDDDLSFTNSPIIVDSRAKKKELEDLSQFLRTLSSAYNSLGINVIEKNDHKYVTLSSREIPNNSTSAYSSGLLGYFLTKWLSPDIFKMEENYKNSIFTSLEFILDNEYNFLLGTPQKDGYDLIRNFTKNRKIYLAETVFKNRSNYYYGRFNREENMYNIWLFENN